ncbi:ATP-binding protein [Oceanobacillus alkalisoli]|uniref:ATP-binding protein n=1 Tax=Oceanobacillus alkalisoli TaxID=2925113 RepID=UPI001F11E51C|nr:ATP-binding protein [Oceanobacillus alkalisoli]MCF3942342.1 ATP-binding protein [Oceanobacillus alkalisoli]
MKIGEVYSLKFDQQQLLFSNFPKLPTNILEWMGSHLNDAFIVWDEKDRICFVSQSIKKLLGYKQEELIGNPWYERIQPLEPKCVEQYLAAERKEGIHVELIHKNNHTVYVEVCLARIEDQSSNRKYVAGLLKDLTAYKEAKEMIVQAKRMSVVGQLTASIAHEIRNPLTSIKGFLQLLKAGVNHKEEYYRIMEDEIEKIESITSELLFMSKPSSNKKKKEHIGKLISDVVVLLQSQAKFKNVTIKYDESISGVIYCDPSQIKQVLINLVKNAIEAMEEPGDISISVDFMKEQTIINVVDEGIGIPQELMDQLGEAFFTTKENGTGLGLNITREIMEQHGGLLKFFRNESKGSTFQIIFPKTFNH